MGLVQCEEANSSRLACQLLLLPDNPLMDGGLLRGEIAAGWGELLVARVRRGADQIGEPCLSQVVGVGAIV